MFLPTSVACAACSLVVCAPLRAQIPSTSQADSLPVLRFVTVEPNVRLETVDWGGAGQPLVLLAGLGNTAHVFADLAHDLRANYHVFGITRRGFGRSSVPQFGYSADRLGDDVLAILDSLHLVKPVLVGHSIAGEELSSIGSRHGSRVSALIYLDAADAYAFYDTTTGDVRVDLDELRRKLDTLRNAPSKQLIDELLMTLLPTFERDLRDLRDLDTAGSPPPLPALDAPDRSTFAAFRAWRARAFGFAVPIAELHEQFEQLPDGSVGRPTRSPEDVRFVSQAIVAGLRKYLGVSAPVLAIFAHPQPPGNFPSAAARAAFITRDSTFRAKQAGVVQRAAPYARVVDVPGASHYVFLTNEADVVREINAFVASLPAGRDREHSRIEYRSARQAAHLEIAHAVLAPLFEPFGVERRSRIGTRSHQEKGVALSHEYVVTPRVAVPRIIAAVHARVPVGAVSSSFRRYLDQVYAAAGTGAVHLDGQNVFLYHGVPDRPAELDVAFGVGVTAPFATVDAVQPTHLPAGEVATTTHWGSYAKLGAAHAAVVEWCRAHGRQRTGASWEVYGHWTDDETSLRTDVFHLLQPLGLTSR